MSLRSKVHCPGSVLNQVSHFSHARIIFARGGVQDMILVCPVGGGAIFATLTKFCLKS